MGFTISTGFSTNVNSTIHAVMSFKTISTVFEVFPVALKGQWRKMIATKCQHRLYIVVQGCNVRQYRDRRNLLVKECHMDIEKGCESWDDDFFSVSPLWCAASTGICCLRRWRSCKSSVTDMNADWDNGMTLVNYACSLTNRETMKVELLITNGGYSWFPRHDQRNGWISRQPGSGYQQTRQTRRNLSESIPFTT